MLVHSALLSTVLLLQASPDKTETTWYGDMKRQVTFTVGSSENDANFSRKMVNTEYQKGGSLEYSSCSSNHEAHQGYKAGLTSNHICYRAISKTKRADGELTVPFTLLTGDEFNTKEKIFKQFREPKTLKTEISGSCGFHTMLYSVHTTTIIEEVRTTSKKKRERRYSQSESYRHVTVSLKSGQPFTIQDLDKF